MAIQTITLTFEGKKTGSIVENKNIAYKNDVEFIQTEYDLIYGSELRVTTADKLNFEFPLPSETIAGLQYCDIYYKSKMDTGENELRCDDKAVYNKDTTMYKQKLLEVNTSNITDDTVKFDITTIGDYGIYEVKIDVIYDDNGLNNYGGQYQYLASGGVITTVPIQNKKLNEIVTELESKPVNSITNVTFAQTGTEFVDS